MSTAGWHVLVLIAWAVSGKEACKLGCHTYTGTATADEVWQQGTDPAVLPIKLGRGHVAGAVAGQLDCKTHINYED